MAHTFPKTNQVFFGSLTQQANSMNNLHQEFSAPKHAKVTLWAYQKFPDKTARFTSLGQNQGSKGGSLSKEEANKFCYRCRSLYLT